MPKELSPTAHNDEISLDAAGKGADPAAFDARQKELERFASVDLDAAGSGAPRQAETGTEQDKDLQTAHNLGGSAVGSTVEKDTFALDDLLTKAAERGVAMAGGLHEPIRDEFGLPMDRSQPVDFQRPPEGPAAPLVGSGPR